MVVFTGQFQHTIDDKGRLSIPARVREDLREGSYMTKGPDHCLFLYAADDWKALCQRGKERLSFTNPNNRAFSRMFFSGAEPLELDKLGRTRIPGHLRDYAGLDKDVIIIGAGSRMEIWDKAAWDNYSAATTDDYDTIISEMADFDVDLF